MALIAENGETITCPKCGSERLLEGSGYERSLTRCLECGNVTHIDFQKGLEMNSQELPEFDSYEEMVDFLEERKRKSPKKKVSKKKKSSSRKRKPASPVDKGKDATGIPNEQVMASMHYYVRAGENWQNVLQAAKQEKEYRMENVRVFAHNHVYGADCKKLCREV